MTDKLKIALLSMLTLAAQPALSAPTAIQAEIGKEWLHQSSGVPMPPSISSFVREDIRDYTETESDIVAAYRDKESQTFASVFVFRAGVVDVPMWQDRTLKAIAANSDRYGNLGFAQRAVSTFTPQGRGQNSGLRIVMPLSGQNFTATGSAMLPSDRWIIAVRMTSQRLSPSALDQTLATFVAQLPLPQVKKPGAAAYMIENCTGEPLPDKKSKRTKPDMADVLMLTVMETIVEDVEEAKSDASSDRPETSDAITPYCRALAGGTEMDVYRHIGQTSGYVIAFGDSGMVVEVSRNDFAAAFGISKNFSMILRTSEAAQIYQGFRSLPPPAQVIEAINRDRPVGSVGRTPGNKTLNVSPVE